MKPITRLLLSGIESEDYCKRNETQHWPNSSQKMLTVWKIK